MRVTTIAERCKTEEWKFYIYRRIHFECQKAITAWFEKQRGAK